MQPSAPAYGAGRGQQPEYGGPQGTQLLRLIEREPRSSICRKRELSFLMLIPLYTIKEDPERRVALQLAFLRRFPFVDRPGCSCRKPLCFKCKSSGFHDGQTCTDKQRETADIEAMLPPSR